MKKSLYRGFFIENKTDIPDDWKVLIKNKVLQGHLSAVKKSIDWWHDTGAIIAPRDFGDMGETAFNEKKSKYQSEDYKGFSLKNDSGEVNTWYCMYQGKLAKGTLAALKSFLDKQEK